MFRVQKASVEGNQIKTSKLLIILSLLAFAPCHAEDSEAVSIAKRVAMGGEHIDMDANAKQITSMLIANNPDLAEHETKIIEILLNHFQSEELLDGMANIYVENFSLQELRELELLMQNPVMIKWLENMPKIMPQIMAVQRTSLERVIANIDDLIAE